MFGMMLTAVDTNLSAQTGGVQLAAITRAALNELNRTTLFFAHKGFGLEFFILIGIWFLFVILVSSAAAVGATIGHVRTSWKRRCCLALVGMLVGWSISFCVFEAATFFPGFPLSVFPVVAVPLSGGIAAYAMVRWLLSHMGG